MQSLFSRAPERFSQFRGALWFERVAHALYFAPKRDVGVFRSACMNLMRLISYIAERSPDAPGCPTKGLCRCL